MRSIFEDADRVSLIRSESDPNSPIGLEIATDAQNQHFVNKLMRGGRAERAGLTIGAQILRVCGVNVRGESHGRLVRLVASHRGSTLTFVTRPTVESIKNSETAPRVQRTVSQAQTNLQKRQETAKIEESDESHERWVEQSRKRVAESLEELKSAVFCRAETNVPYRFDGSFSQRIGAMRF